eukprot:gene4355-6162_t
MSSDDDNNELQSNSYTQKQILKEETEAPFRKIRIFIYISLLGAAGIGTVISLTKLLAATLSPRGTDDMFEIYSNLAINILGLPTIGYLWKRELDSQKSLLDRIQKGGSLAGLKVKLTGENGDVVCKLSDLRRDRGNDKRVVIVAAPKDLLKSSLVSSIEISADLTKNELLIVPLEIIINDSNNISDFTLTGTSLNALQSSNESTSESPKPSMVLDHIGSPVALSSWNNVLKREIGVALKQQPDALSKGVTIIIKKNGKVGTRRFGVPIWEGLVDDVALRSELGMDIRNI